MSERKAIVFGTSNPAKIEQVRGALELSGVDVQGIDEFSISLEIEEDGSTAQENAKKKAVAYAKAINRQVFAMDNALYFKGFAEDQQPGLHVRRIGDEARSTDEEMVKAYKQLVADNGGRLDAWWEFGVSLANPNGSSTEDSIVSPRIFVSEASDVILPGYPLESLQIDPKTDGYISEKTSEERAVFWQEQIGEPLGKFVLANLS